MLNLVGLYHYPSQSVDIRQVVISLLNEVRKINIQRQKHLASENTGDLKNRG